MSFTFQYSIKTSQMVNPISIIWLEILNVATYDNKISLEGKLQGTFTIKNKVYDASRYIQYEYNPNNKKLSFEIWSRHQGLFSFNLFINDNNCKWGNFTDVSGAKDSNGDPQRYFSPCLDNINGTANPSGCCCQSKDGWDCRINHNGKKYNNM